MGSVKPFKDINKISEEQSQDSLATMYIDHSMIVFDLGEEPKSDFSINLMQAVELHCKLGEAIEALEQIILGKDE